MKSYIRSITCSLALLSAVGAAGCTGAAYSSAYYDPYLYYGYYPSDVYYSSYYWSDPYYYSYLGAYSGGGGSTGVVGGTGGAGGSTVGGTGGAGGSSTTSGTQTLGDAVRALARGESVCPGQVTVTPKMGPPPCGGFLGTLDSNGMVRTGVTLVFNGCQLSNGARIDGTIDVDSTRTASNTACDSTTTITLMHTSTTTNLTYTGAGGRKLVIPSATGTTTTTYTNGQAPVAPNSTVQGRLQVVGSDGVMISDQAYTGNITVTPAQDRSSYAVDGTLTLQDQLAAGTTTLTATGLRRSTNCCQPDAGTLQINRTNGANPGTHTWSFGSSCGAATFDSNPISLPACI